MVNTVFSRDSCRMCRCAWDSAAVATTRVGPVASARLMSACTWEGPTDEMKILLMPTSGSPRSWKPHPPRSAAIAKRDANRSNNDVHQPSGDHDHLLYLLARDEFHDSLVPQGGLLDFFAARRSAHRDVPAQLAVHLHHELDGVLHERGRVHRGPGLVDQLGSWAKLAPQRRRDVRHDGREEENRVLETSWATARATGL